jgi:glycosyltransferase involved in cell wall biosynthesis
MTLHIAWLGKKSPFCGNVTYSREVTNHLTHMGHRVSFLHFAQEEELEEQTFLSQTVRSDSPLPEEVPLPFLYRSQVYTLPSLKARKVLTESLRDLKPDVVHASLTLSPLDFVLPEICEELGLPLVATFHPAFDRRRNNFAANTQYLMYQLYAPCLAAYQRVIVFSQLQKEILSKMGVSSARIVVIPNGVDVEKYSPGLSNAKSHFEADRLFVYMGRVSVEKNLEPMLKAWKSCRDLIDGHHSNSMNLQHKLVIMGDGPQRPLLQNFYTEEDGIIWLGFVASEEERLWVLRGADVFVLPSLVEGLSISLLEAMACGLAVVATDVGADGEVLAGGAGIMVQPYQVQAQLRTLIPLFVEHPEFIKILGEKARARVIDRYTLGKNIDTLAKLYDEILGRVPVETSLS